MERFAVRKSPPLVGQVIEALRQGLADGRFAGGKLPAERELSAALGVSRGTLRQALAELGRQGLVCRVHGKGTLVGPRAVRRAPAAAGRLGLLYYARYVDEGVDGTFYGEIFGGILDEAEKFSRTIVVKGIDHRRKWECLPAIEGGGVEGLLLIAVPDGELLARIDALGLPAVLVDHRSDSPAFESINPDDGGGARAAVEFLAGLGHRDIGCLRWSNWRLCPERVRSYERTLASLGLACRPEWIEEGESTIEGGRAAMGRLLAKSPRPTAVLALSDHMAWGALDAARLAGARVPEDLSLIGFGGDPPRPEYGPALTTMGLDRVWLGRLAIRRLLKRIKSPGLKKTDHLVPMRVVERSSCAPPPKAAAAAEAVEGRALRRA